MAFADPQSITPTGGSAITLNRTAFGSLNGAFGSDDALTVLAIKHDRTTKRTRHLARIDQSKSVSDPLVPANNTISRISAYLVVDSPAFGYTVAEQKAFVGALTAWATASSAANITKLLGLES